MLVKEWAKEKTIQIKTYPSAEAFMFNYTEEKDFDILLLDIEKGKMDGVTMAKTIRQNNESIQIVFITGYVGSNSGWFCITKRVPFGMCSKRTSRRDGYYSCQSY